MITDKIDMYLGENRLPPIPVMRAKMQSKRDAAYGIKTASDDYVPSLLRTLSGMSKDCIVAYNAGNEKLVKGVMDDCIKVIKDIQRAIR